MSELQHPKSYWLLWDWTVKWNPTETKPVNFPDWYEAIEEIVPMGGGFVQFTWDSDVWQITTATSRFRVSPSGTIGKGMDVREELKAALLAKGLPIVE